MRNRCALPRRGTVPDLPEAFSLRVHGTTDLQQLLEARAILRTVTGRGLAETAANAPEIEPFAPVHLSPEARARLAIQALSGLTPAQFNQAFVEMADAGIIESLFQFKLDDPELRTLLETVARVLGPGKAEPFMALLDFPELPPASPSLPRVELPPARVPPSAEIIELAKVLSRELTQLAPETAHDSAGLTRANIVRADSLRQAGNLAAILLGGEGPVEESFMPAPSPLRVVPPILNRLGTGAASALNYSAATDAIHLAPQPQSIPLPSAPEPAALRPDPAPLLRELVAVITPEVLPAGRSDLVQLLRRLSPAAPPPNSAEVNAPPTLFNVLVRDTAEIRAAIERVARHGLEISIDPLLDDADLPMLRIAIPFPVKFADPNRINASEVEKESGIQRARIETIQETEPQKSNGTPGKGSDEKQSLAGESPAEFGRARNDLPRIHMADRPADSIDRPLTEKQPEPRVDRIDIPLGLGPISPAVARPRGWNSSANELLTETGVASSEFVPIPREKAMVLRPPAPFPARLDDVTPQAWAPRLIMIEQLTLPANQPATTTPPYPQDTRSPTPTGN